MSKLQGESMVESENGMRQYPTVQRWLRNKAQDTIDGYIRAMDHYSQLSGKSPEQFAAWATTVEGVDVQDVIDGFSEDGLTDATKFTFKIAMRSFLRHQGFNDLPKSRIEYTLHEFHRGYKPAEVKKLLSYLDNIIHKLYVTISVEAGFRSKTTLAIKYKHIAEDYEAGIVPCAVRFEPKFYVGKKAAGYCFLGARSVALIKECIKAGLVEQKADSPIFPVGYAAMYDAVKLAHKKAGLDPRIQPSHGLRKCFENNLDTSGIDHEQKMILEGHFEGARGKHYTDREFDTLRPIYAQAYPHLDVEGSDPELEKKLVDWQAEKTKLEGENRQLKQLLTNAETRFDREIKALRELVEQRTGHKKRA